MTLKIEDFERNSFPVQGVQVTPENMAEVAEWCKGTIHTEDKPGREKGKQYIQVNVKNVLTPRQSQAFSTDWVLVSGTGYKVYTNKAMFSNFHRAENKPEEKNVFATSDIGLFSGGSASGSNPGGTASV